MRNSRPLRSGFQRIRNSPSAPVVAASSVLAVSGDVKRERRMRAPSSGLAPGTAEAIVPRNLSVRRAEIVFGGLRVSDTTGECGREEAGQLASWESS